MNRSNAPLILLAGYLISLPALAMQALDDEQLDDVSGAGLSFFIDGFSYDQAAAMAKITGVKNSQNADVVMDITGAYIKGAGSQRGAQDVKAYLGTPMHPFLSGPTRYRSGANIPVGQQALQLMTPTWADPINDTHKFGLWSYYQGCLFGEAGCGNPGLASTKVNAELTSLTRQRDSLLANYQNNMAALKSSIDRDMVTVAARRAELAPLQSDVNAKQSSMAARYPQLPEQICGLGCTPRPPLGQTYGCPWFANCSSVQAYNDAVSAYTTSMSNLQTAQQNLGTAWSVTWNGKPLSQRASDYDQFVQLCGVQSASTASCAGGTVTQAQKSEAVVQEVAAAMNGAAGTRIQGLDIGLRAQFTLPNVNYGSNGLASGTSTRQDALSIDLENFTLNGSYLNLWGDAAGLKASMSLQMYADKLIVGGCQNCTDNDRLVARNLYFDLNLGDATYQPATLTVASNGDLVLNAPGVTWANHDAFYRNVQKSNVSIGNLNIGGTDLGSQAIRGMRIDYLDVRLVSLPR
ncbi:hypothetical protein [Pseudomonas aeruginosa]|uniref:hypothetical protein n=1 Tax=Pseudomonas aeruginosa TaxID=287 RepID=UPI003F2D46B5